MEIGDNRELADQVVTQPEELVAGMILPTLSSTLSLHWSTNKAY
jgi:hypothetical protein